jgi:hypothetical protein
MRSLANSSAPNAWRRPAGRIERPVIEVGRTASSGCSLSSCSRSIRPCSAGTWRNWAIEDLGWISVNQDDQAPPLGGEAERQIERHEGLALALARAGHHDEIGVGDPVGPCFIGTLQDDALDQPELLRGPIDGGAGREHPGPGQPSGIDVDPGPDRAAGRAAARPGWLAGTERSAAAQAGWLGVTDGEARPPRATERAHLGDCAFHDRADAAAVGLGSTRC